ncbi:hypothetical protein SAMN05661096_03609 [Marivirga sericea]|uniref:Uncharacterized protein n=2 Tax=Marivirga sericea TaxID=1028 RepID=A0A1X7L6E8_9BACT|nr:hypothetical protein SAMN05661096_03609 [Marivirga sericea]
MSKSRISIKRDQKPKSTDDFFSNFEINKDLQEETKSEQRRTVEYVRQTFLLSKEHLNKIKDFVHTKRKNGDTNYTQKQAVQDALNLLFNSVEVIEPRNK